MIASHKLLTRRDCVDALSQHREPSPAEVLQAVATVPPDAEPDVYGAGNALGAFEQKIATELGKEAAVFMPSGTMAQQIALRIVADRRAIRGFAGHPTNHVVLHEHAGFARLHFLDFIPVGGASRLITPDDVRAICEPVGTLLLELPQREIGGELPTWDDLAAIAAEGRSRNWHLHLDGARLWECGPAYGRPYREIAAFFDTAYVSFYKGLGGIGGAMLAGPASFIEEARVWQRRHGGNLVTLFPYWVAAERCFDERINRMGAYHQAALRIARALEAYPSIAIRPKPPQTNMLHAFVRGTAQSLMDRAQHVARTHGIWTISRLSPTPLPNVHRWEISCGDATLALSDDRLRLALDELFLH